MKLLPLMSLLSLCSFLSLLQHYKDCSRSSRRFYLHLLLLLLFHVLLLDCTYISSLYTPISESSHLSKQSNHMLSESRVELLMYMHMSVVSTGVAKGSGMPQKTRLRRGNFILHSAPMRATTNANTIPGDPCLSK
jgi:cellulose synthase/poly-beta-1,6-N-acetylglucosamine synthase-like glycosyltransferase